MIDYSDIEIIKKVKEHCNLANKAVLEIGCGDGRISSKLAPGCASFIAIDPDKKSIDKAKTTFPGIDFRVGSGEKNSFPESSFDIVIFTLSLHHQNSYRALDEASRVVKTNGQVIIVEPVIDGELEKVCAFLNNEDTQKLHAQYAINMSSFSVVSSEILNSKWVFESENDLFQSLFEYYNMPFDSDIAMNIKRYLGNRIKSEPITLTDKMIVQVLQ